MKSHNTSYLHVRLVSVPLLQHHLAHQLAKAAHPYSPSSSHRHDSFASSFATFLSPHPLSKHQAPSLMVPPLLAPMLKLRQRPFSQPWKHFARASLSPIVSEENSEAMMSAISMFCTELTDPRVWSKSGRRHWWCVKQGLRPFTAPTYPHAPDVASKAHLAAFDSAPAATRSSKTYDTQEASVYKVSFQLQLPQAVPTPRQDALSTRARDLLPLSGAEKLGWIPLLRKDSEPGSSHQKDKRQIRKALDTGFQLRESHGHDADRGLKGSRDSV